jgi:malate dehydrogenase
MFRVTIIGGGELAGAIAQRLAERDVVSTIRLVDDQRSVAAGKALDLIQSAPLRAFSTTVLASSSLESDDVDLVVIADSVDRGEWHAENGLMLVKSVAERYPRAPLLCAGANQRELVEQSVRELHLGRNRIVGTAPEALAASLRAVVALEVNGSPFDVALTVLGIPPSHIVVPWDEATIGGRQAVRMLDEPTRRRLSARTTALWPPGPYALAAAAVQGVEGVFGRSRRMISCFVGPDDSSGMRTRAAALPVRFGPNGITPLALPALNGYERVVLENAMML